MSTDRQAFGDSNRRQSENGWRYAAEHDLDITDDQVFHDIGVSAFKGDNLSSGALGRFMDAAEKGEIERGSYLLIEGFDRLSRENPRRALLLLIRFNSLGIHVVTLSDRQVYRADDETNTSQLYVSLAVMHRAHEESLIKSQRGGAVWAWKRDQADRFKLTKVAPFWLRLSPDRTFFEPLDERVQVLRRIFEESAAGCGSLVIAKRLNADKVQPFGRAERWIPSYVTKILGNRAVLGEYQPHRIEDGKRTPVGNPIVDYFPCVIDPDLFLRVQHGRHKRRERDGGRKGPRLANLFTGLAKCGYCGSSMRYLNKGQGPKGGTYLQCSGALQGSECVTVGWRYCDFETSFISFVREIDLTTLIGDTDVRKALKSLENQVESQSENLRQREMARDRTMELVMASTMDKEHALRYINAAELAVKDAMQALADLAVERDACVSKLEGLRPSDHHLIDHMRTLGDDERYLLRTQIASRLKDTITSLKLEVIGPAGHRRTMHDYLPSLFALEEQEGQPSHGRRRASVHPWAPRFEVQFATGATRTVEVSRTDPTLVEDGLSVDQHGHLCPLASDGSELDPLIGSL